MENKPKKDTKKPLVGFFPCFYSMGETIPLIKIAKSYMDMGGKAIFFSHGGDYEYLAEEIGCKVVKLNDILENLSAKGKHMFKTGGNLGQKFIKLYSKKIIQRAVKEEINAFKKADVDMIISSFNLTGNISARAIKKTYITVVSGVTIPPYYEAGLATFPDNHENLFTRFLPDSFKNRVLRWLLLHNIILVRKFNKIGKKYNVPKFKYFNDILLGDQTFVCDDINFLGLTSSEKFPADNFIGPIAGGKLFGGKQEDFDKDIVAHLKRPGKSIVIIMGSTGVKSLFLKIIDALSKTDYNVIAAYTNLFEKEELPKVGDNILFKKFIPFDSLLKHTDLPITHGGRGTIHQIAFSGKPAICIPMFLEHQGNVDNLVRQGSAIRLSKTYFKKDKLLQAIDEIFNNYEKYQKNAQKLAKSLENESGDIKAAKRIFEILESYNN